MATAIEVEGRWREVYRLRLQGKSVREIGKALSIAPTAAYRDLQRAQVYFRSKYLAKFDPYELVTQTCYVIDAVRGQAMELAWTTVDAGVRLQALKLVAEMSLRLVWMMQEIGALPKNLGTMRVDQRDHNLPAVPAVATIRAFPVPGGRLTTDDVIARYETVFGTFAPSDRQRVVALDRQDPRVQDSEGSGLPESRPSV